SIGRSVAPGGFSSQSFVRSCWSFAAALRLSADAMALKRAFCSSLERLIEALESRAHGLHGCKHDLQPDLHGREPSGRDAGQILRTTGLEHVDRFGACGTQFVQRGTLRISWLHHLGDALDRPVGELRGGAAANFRRAALATVWPRRIAT